MSPAALSLLRQLGALPLADAHAPPDLTQTASLEHEGASAPSLLPEVDTAKRGRQPRRVPSAGERGRPAGAPFPDGRGWWSRLPSPAGRPGGGPDPSASGRGPARRARPDVLTAPPGAAGGAKP
jgi:hypothetical protein